MVVIAEWALPLFRIAIIALTPVAFLRTTPIKLLVAALVVVNVVMLYLGWHRRGPYSRGAPGILFDLLLALVSMTVFVALLPAHTFAQGLPASPLPLANYLTPCAAALAVWSSPRRQARHLQGLWAVRDLVLVGLLVPLLAGFCLLNGYSLDELRWADLTMQAVPTWIALLIGYAIARIAADFAAAQAELVRAQTEERLSAVEQEHNRHFDWLHSRVLPVLGTISLHLESGRITTGEAAKAARDVDVAIREQRHRDLLNEREVRLADIVSFYMRWSNPRRDGAGLPVAGAGLGGVTLDGETADLVDRALGGLVSNANKYAGPDRWTCAVSRAHGTIVIRVEDDGPGFPGSHLSRPGSSLNDLRCALEAAGGRLRRLQPASGSATIMEARIPEEYRAREHDVRGEDDGAHSARR